MAQADSTLVVNITQFRGTENENLEEFERQMVTSIGAAGTQDADGHLYFQLDLMGGAVAHYDHLPSKSQQNFDAAIASLRQRYVNPRRAELQCILLDQQKFRLPAETVHNFLTDLERFPLGSLVDVETQQVAKGGPAGVAGNRELEQIG